MASLNQLLTAIDDLEEGYLDLSPEQIKELVGDVRNKADAIHEILGRMESEEERLKKNIEILANRKKAISNSRTRLKEYVSHCLQVHDMPAIYGKVWDIKLQKRKKYNIREATLEDAQEREDLVDLTYKFNRKKLEEEFQKGTDFGRKAVTLGESVFIRFAAHKDLD
jgi:hypothetical protein